MNFNLVIMLECFIFFIFNFVIVRMILKWQNLKCLCANDKKKDYIFYISIFYLFYILLFLVYPELLVSKTMFYLVLITIPLTVIYLYILLQYIRELEEKNCDCVKMQEINIFKWYTYIFVILVIIEYMYLAYYFMRSPEYKTILNNFINNKRMCTPINKNINKNKNKNKNKKYRIYNNFPIQYVIKKIN